jgi:hypothetical protein
MLPLSQAGGTLPHRIKVATQVEVERYKCEQGSQVCEKSDGAPEDCSGKMLFSKWTIMDI